MRVEWTSPALDDVEAVVPEQLRARMLKKLENLSYIGQARPCTDVRYPGARYVKYERWYVKILETAPGEITVIAVEYNFGQAP